MTIARIVHPFIRSICFACVLPAPCAGCETVKPWQRETLADPIMQPGDRNATAAAQLNHVYFSREAASAGATVGGSGCGCND
jgi:hypothetical protein